MKETRFIEQNKEKWLESEKLLSATEKDPEKLSTLFTQVIDDLSYSRTYYPNRSVRVYLNKIGREYFSIIYSHKKEKKNHFKLFWTDELPQIVYVSRKPLLISLIVFLVALTIGVFSAINDPQFTATILGDSYVAMTKANIEKGDPMAVYKSYNEIDMFLGITINNLLVAFRTYVCGIFLSIGTIAILLYNGIMVGCFQYFFIERNLLAESALTIWLHGTLEISSIILAGGAGLTLGSGLIFPGTYSRLQAFQLSAIRSLKLMLGIAPIIVFAAIIESFLTRYTEAPDFLRLMLIILSAVFIVGYFVVYPWLKAKKGFDHPLEEARLAPYVPEPVNFGRIKNNAEILKDAFNFYRKYAGKFLPWIAGISLVLTAFDFFSGVERNPSVYVFEWWQDLINNLFYAMKTPTPMFILANGIGTGLIVYLISSFISSEAQPEEKRSTNWSSLLQCIVIMSLVHGMLYLLEGWGTLILMITFILFLVYVFVQHIERTNMFSAIGGLINLAGANFGQFMGLQFILLLLSFSFLIILTAPLLYFNTTILEWNFSDTDTWGHDVVRFVETFIRIFGFNMIFPIMFSGAAYLYFTTREILSADSLKASIELMGSQRSKTGKR